jgi:hypothetical protein
MPLVTLTVRKPKTPAFKSAVLAAVHRALVAAGVPEKDLFHRVLELATPPSRGRRTSCWSRSCSRWGAA